MDNLTHSLIGAAFARSLPKRYQRSEIFWASVIGNNLPDADFLVRIWPGSTQLDYLLQHRGYTHSLVLAPILAVFTALLAKTFTRKSRWSFALFFVSFAAVALHIGADYLNNYGVHPFTPVLNRWYYGDSIYIVEPLIWFSLLPFIARETDRSWAKVGWWILGASMLVLVWLFPTFSPGLSGALTVFFILSGLLIQSSATSLRRTLTTVGILAFVIGGFAFEGHRARKIARDFWQSASEGTETWLDASSSPAPGNPLCWGVWTAVRAPKEFRFRAADVSLLPDLIPASECKQVTLTEHTADLTRPAFASNDRIHWVYESRLAISDWELFQAKSERFRRILSFARFPFIKRFPDGHAIAGDLRYDRQAGVGFAEVEIPANEAPSARNGPWERPIDRR